MPVRTLIAVALTAVLLLCGAVTLAGPAQAAARVEVGGAVDPSAASTLTLRGSGFQSIRNGHGGVYVFFGTVRPGWRPSQGGATGRDYFYVPDSESRSNQGYQKFVAFPGSDTASSANGGTMTDGGTWSTTVRVPGPVFRAYDRGGRARTIDCREVACGVITVGAHGVVNAGNETFTPVPVADVPTPASTAPSAREATPSTAPQATIDPAASTDDEQAASTTNRGRGGEGGTSAAADKDGERRPVAVEVDRASATAGHVLPFTATGMTPGSQVSAVLDDGLAANGPYAVGPTGQVAGVLTLPADLEPGTHELRLFGAERAPRVRFAVATSAEVEPLAEETRTVLSGARPAVLFAVACGLVLAAVVVRALVLRRRTRPARVAVRRA